MNFIKLIPLTKSHFAIVDAGLFEKLSRHKWSLNEAAPLRPKYAVRRHGKDLLRMHRLIIDAPKGIQVDHINGDGLDNRKENLRLVSVSQNQINRGLPVNNTSGFKGVSWMSSCNKWFAQIRATVNGKKTQKYLGLFLCKESAARAYDKEALSLFGPHAWLNFPESSR